MKIGKQDLMVVRAIIVFVGIVFLLCIMGYAFHIYVLPLIACGLCLSLMGLVVISNLISLWKGHIDEE